MVISGTATTEAPRPKSPPAYPDFCGRHKLQVEVQSMNREIGFLKEEIHSLEELPPASKCCKEVNEFVGTKPDPLIPMTRRKHKSCRCWRWIRAKLCLNFSWVCCSCKCSFKFRKPTCFSNPCKKCCCNCKPKCCSCHCPSCHCFDCGCVNLFQCSRCSKCCCWDIFSCCKPSCACPKYSCPKCSCGCVFSCPNCSDACLCLRCTRPCCVSRCLCP